MNQSKKG